MNLQQIVFIFLFVAVATAHVAITKRSTLEEKAKNIMLLIKDMKFLKTYINDATNCNEAQMEKVTNILKTFENIHDRLYDEDGNVVMSEKDIDSLTLDVENEYKVFKDMSSLEGFNRNDISNAADYVASLLKNGVRAKVMKQVLNLFSEKERAESAVAVLSALQFLLPHYKKKLNCDERVYTMQVYASRMIKFFQKGIKSQTVTHEDVDREKKKIDSLVKMLSSALG